MIAKDKSRWLWWPVRIRWVRNSTHRWHCAPRVAGRHRARARREDVRELRAGIPQGVRADVPLRRAEDLPRQAVCRSVAVTLPKDPKARKETPIFRGLFRYFPDALAEVAHVSFVGNEQHNPGEPMHWAKEKSTDEPDALLRHMLDLACEPAGHDVDGLRHAARWRGARSRSCNGRSRRSARPKRKRPTGGCSRDTRRHRPRRARSDRSPRTARASTRASSSSPGASPTPRRCSPRSALTSSSPSARSSTAVRRKAAAGLRNWRGTGPSPSAHSARARSSNTNPTIGRGK